MSDWIKKQQQKKPVVYPYFGIPFSNQKGQTIDTHNNLYESQENCM